MKPSVNYRGRFAPSPTGSLHFGSLVAALGSYLDARHQQGEWLLRMEDLDPPREVPGAGVDIIRTLESLGMTWDGPITYQSQRGDRYQEALDRLQQKDTLYDCGCTRKEVSDQAIETGSGAIYPGTCRQGLPPGRKARALRVRVGTAVIQMTDRLQPALNEQLDLTTGDFIVRRADKLVAYQLAVVVDDAAQHINQIVRGCDLLESTPRQIYLQQLLGLPTPAYLHLPVAADARKVKLSKQSKAQTIAQDDDNSAVIDALRFLQQELPDSPRDASPEELLRWATDHWDCSRIPACLTLPAPDKYADRTRT